MCWLKNVQSLIFLFKNLGLVNVLTYVRQIPGSTCIMYLCSGNEVTYCDLQYSYFSRTAIESWKRAYMTKT